MRQQSASVLLQLLIVLGFDLRLAGGLPSAHSGRDGPADRRCGSFAVRLVEESPGTETTPVHVRGTGELVQVASDRILTLQDVVSATHSIRQNMIRKCEEGGRNCVPIRVRRVDVGLILTAAGLEKLRTFMPKHVGRSLAVVFDDEVISTSIIMSPNLGHQEYLPLSGSWEGREGPETVHRINRCLGTATK